MAEAPTLSEDAEQEAGPRKPLPVDSADVRAASIMGVFFVGTILLAVVLARTLQGQVAPVFEDPESVTNPLIYLALVIVFTVVILVIAKLGFQRIIQWIILGAVLFTMAYVFQPILAHFVPGIGDASYIVALAGAVGLTVLLFLHPEWYVVDAAGVSVAAGATGLFGFSFGLAPALVLLVAFAVYDFIAVYRTRHMLDLADAVLTLKLPVMLVVPKVRGYSFLAGESIDKDKPAQERDALFMGLGDIVIPGVLVVSSMVFLADASARYASVWGLAPHALVSLSTLLGATVGFFFLMRGVVRGTPHAGLPALNGGALVGFLVPLLWLYGVDPIVPHF